MNVEEVAGRHVKTTLDEYWFELYLLLSNTENAIDLLINAHRPWESKDLIIIIRAPPDGIS